MGTLQLITGVFTTLFTRYQTGVVLGQGIDTPIRDTVGHIEILQVVLTMFCLNLLKILTANSDIKF